MTLKLQQSNQAAAAEGLTLRIMVVNMVMCAPIATMSTMIIRIRARGFWTLSAE